MGEELLSEVDGSDYIRAFNVFGSALVIIMAAFRLKVVWHYLSNAQRWLVAALLLYAFYAAVVSTQLIFVVPPSGYRVRLVIHFLANVSALIYLFEPFRAYVQRLGVDPLGGYDFRKGTPPRPER